MPLTFDMLLEEPSAYQGRNPRPADFDTFWDQSLVALSCTPT
jgi:cephalosporin-C deacetylase